MNSVKILVPRLYNVGGVANYYSTLRGYIGQEYEYIYRGNTSRNESKLKIPWRMLKDYSVFYRKTRYGAKAIVINSSLGAGGFIRDGLYFLLAPWRVRKIVFFRGWNPGFEKKIDDSSIMKAWLKKTFLRADHILVLSSEFKSKLRQWGFEGPVNLGSTLVGENLLENESLEILSSFRHSNESTNILYLGNISKAKGVWDVIKAYKILYNQEGLQNLKCIIAGDGQELNELTKYSRTHDLDIEFPGYVREKQKTAVFKNAHLYVFPSAHHEGMPTSVLEAMAFGLPVITTRVGGLSDFFEDGKMGLFLDSREPEHIAEKIRYLLERPEVMRQMSEYNHRYAKEHFYASKVARHFESIIESVIKRNHE
ncbi:MAG: glycosyltransferase family 4 protein [Desulfotomaculaceae bacterium]|nr:glycosyltransferase family 4 protein [Desulfotomaculaceae bacterium]